MFVGRKKELQFLEDAYKNGKAEFIVLYGRRRVGKTELLTRFCKDKKNIFYSSKEVPNEAQLLFFSKQVIDFDKEAFPFVNSFKDWESVFKALGFLASKERLIVVIDEFPYMVKGDKSIPSLLQNLWDHLLKDSQIMLIVSGSAMSFMEEEILGYKKPLYGRATGIYKLEGLPYSDAIKFFPSYFNEDKLLAYSMLGGIPHYLCQFDKDKSLRENVIDKILRRGSPLYNEVEFLLKEELREPSTYNCIIEAIALGNNELNEIYNKTGIERRTLSVYLKNLMDLGLVKKEFSAETPLKKQINNTRGLYTLTDNLFRFYYAYCYPNLSLLEKGDASLVYDHFIKPSLHNFASKTFEEVCIQYLFSLNSQAKLPSLFNDFARYWGKVNHKQDDGSLISVNEEIDVFAYDKSKNIYLLGECKFTNEVFDLGQLKKLQGKLKLKGEVYYYLFSLNGFSEALIEASKEDNHIVLVSSDDLLSL